MTDIQIGDVCLDLAQGRPVHIRADTGQDVATWSEANDYELAENYGNSRLDTQPDDRVFDVVYCSSLKSEPSKTYAMPESRLARVETEAADGGVPVADEVRRALLADLFAEVEHLGNGDLTDALRALASGVAPDAVDAVTEESDGAAVGDRLGGGDDE